MIAGLVLSLVALYALVLFFVAWKADNGPISPARGSDRSLIYALSITVYCTSWMFYGAVGEAAHSGWLFDPFFLGPILSLVLLFPLWRRTAAVVKRENIGSIADFLATRYGKSRALGAMVAIIAVISALPHVVLQLKSLALGWELISQGGAEAPPGLLSIAIIAGVLAAFAIVFGARSAALTDHNRGLIRAVAVSAVVKLLALVALGVFALSTLPDWGTTAIGAAERTQSLGALLFDDRFISMTVLGAIAIFCFPKQFHVGFVELRDTNEMRAVRWLVPLYFVLVAAAIVPIALAGRYHLPNAVPELYSLSLPLAIGQPLIAALVSVGAFAAASSMVVVETVALSAMISNELILPWLTSRQVWPNESRSSFSVTILSVRRGVIVGLLLVASLYLIVDRGDALVTVSQASFVAIAQLAPLFIGALYWQRANRSGAIAGLIGGFVVWLYLLWPLNMDAGRAHLFGLDPVTEMLLATLSVNVVLFVLVSLLTTPSMLEYLQARKYVKGERRTWRWAPPQLSVTVGDLLEFVTHFVGDQVARDGFAEFARTRGLRLKPADPVSPDLARAAELILAGAIGSSSARGVIAAALSKASEDSADILGVLDDAAHAVEFNREILQATLDSLDQGVCVVDRESRLLVWNARFLSMFSFPPDVIRPRGPIESALSWMMSNCEANGEGQEELQGQFDSLRAGARCMFECRIADGRTMRIAGTTMSSDAYIMTFSDVTEDRKKEDALRQAAQELELANETLEARVEQRTRALTEANAALAEANRIAERATAAKTRFIAAASHDLLQPLHAARLFIAALAEDLREVDPSGYGLADNANQAIGAADRLLRALLNLSKLEAGGVRPTIVAMPLAPLLAELEREFTPVAAAKGLELRCIGTNAWVYSDRDLLRSVLQNLLGNAVRYTDRGGILVRCRVRHGQVRIEVWDSGRGIPAAARKVIFQEFTRLASNDAGEDYGMGLGLAIVARILRLLEHGMVVRSRVGRGSLFAVTAGAAQHSPARLDHRRDAPLPLDGLRILCVDDDTHILDGLSALLERWGAKVTRATCASDIDALPARSWDGALIDYHLDGRVDGLEIVRRLRMRIRFAAIVTADSDESIVREAASLGVHVLRKPVDHQALRDFLVSCRVPAAS